MNIRALGARGDGKTDDTAALRAAIGKHKVLYLPGGTYRVTGPIELRPDTVLIGLNPGPRRFLWRMDRPTLREMESRSEY